MTQNCKTSVAWKLHLEIWAQLAAALLNDLIVIKLAKAKMAFIDTWHPKMAISYHFNVKLGRSPSPHASTPGRFTSIAEHNEQADTLWLQGYSINMFTADNYKVTFVPKAQSGVSNTFPSQRSWLEVLDGVGLEGGDDGVNTGQGDQTWLPI